MRSTILTLFFLLASTGLPPATQAADPPRPNVLLITIDDLRPELGCCGLDYVDSPHLDRLASQGTLFTSHFVQVATCGASRYALLTGRSPAASGALRNQAMYEGGTALQPDQQPGAQTLPELFRRNGYHTTLIGKISHTADGRVYAYNGDGDGRDEMPLAWTEKRTPLGPWKRGWGIFFAYSGGRHRESGQGHQDLMEFTVEDDSDLPDGMMADAAIRQLQDFRDSDQPFFLGLGFFKPHLPFVATRQDWEYYENRDVPAPKHPLPVDSPHWHRSSEFYKYDSAMNKTRPLSPTDTLTARRAYLACVRYVDRQAGRVLEALESTGLADNTIVVVWGDHGWHLGDSALWGKHTPFERANHSALIIRAPGVSRPGTRCDALVETIDLYPTLVDLTALPFRETHWPLDGVSLKPLLSGTASQVKPVSLSFWRNSVSVRSPTHRLIVGHSRSGQRLEPELYDIRETADPVHNIAASNPQIVQSLQRYLP